MEIGSSMELNREEPDQCSFSLNTTFNSKDDMLSTEAFVGSAERNEDLTKTEKKTSRKSLASSTLEETPARKQNVEGGQTSYTTPGSIFSESGYKENLDGEAPYTDDRVRVYFRSRAGKAPSYEHRTYHLSCPQLPSKKNFKRKKGESRGILQFSCGMLAKDFGEAKQKNVVKKSFLPQSFIKEKQAYFAEVDAFELQEEAVEENLEKLDE